MRVKELIKALEKYPHDQELEIYFEFEDNEGWDACCYGRIFAISTQENGEKIEIFCKANGYD